MIYWDYVFYPKFKLLTKALLSWIDNHSSLRKNDSDTAKLRIICCRWHNQSKPHRADCPSIAPYKVHINTTFPEPLITSNSFKEGHLKNKWILFSHSSPIGGPKFWRSFQVLWRKMSCDQVKAGYTRVERVLTVACVQTEKCRLGWFEVEWVLYEGNL